MARRSHQGRNGTGRMDWENSSVGIALAVGLLAATAGAAFGQPAGETAPPAPATAPAAVAPPLPATGTLTGVITAQATGKPLVGVKVTVGSQTTTTDASGRFSIELPPGDYVVRLAALAYQP